MRNMYYNVRMDTLMTLGARARLTPRANELKNPAVNAWAHDLTWAIIREQSRANTKEGN